MLMYNHKKNPPSDNLIALSLVFILGSCSLNSSSDSLSNSRSSEPLIFENISICVVDNCTPERTLDDFDFCKCRFESQNSETSKLMSSLELTDADNSHGIACINADFNNDGGTDFLLMKRVSDPYRVTKAKMILYKDNYIVNKIDINADLIGHHFAVAHKLDEVVGFYVFGEGSGNYFYWYDGTKMQRKLMFSGD